MGNNFSGDAGDPNNDCLYCQLGRKWGWEGQGVFHTHDDTTPLFFNEKLKSNKEDIDPLLYLRANVKENPKPKKVEINPLSYLANVKGNLESNKEDIDPLSYLGANVKKNPKPKKADIDPLSYLGTDVKINPQEIEEANILIHQFFEGS